jgi:hypothetical protein
MRLYITSIVLFVFFIACKSDPNKQVGEGKIVDNMYYSKEIGWTFKIPEGWTIIKQEEAKERSDDGMKLISEANGVNYDVSGLKHLINLKKDMFHSFSATSEKFDITYEGEYEETQQYVKEILHKTYANNGIKVDTFSTVEKIDGIKFDRFHITMYGPNGNVILHQDLYSKYIKGFDFGVNLNYINDEKRDELMNAWKNSKFK